MRNQNIPCIDYTEAKKHIGEKKRVTGKVVEVAEIKGNTYLDFSSDYKESPFRCIIFSDHIHKFDDVQKYRGENVEIRGLIKEYGEKAQIVITSPQEIKISSGEEPGPKQKTDRDESDYAPEEKGPSKSGYKYIFLVLAISFAGAVGYFLPHKQKSDITSSYLYEVTKVVDGDTINVKVGRQAKSVRLIGIEAPEIENPYTKEQPFGIESANKVKELLKGKKVILVPDPQTSDRDIYDRLLRYIFLPDGRLVNAILVKEGFAFSSDYSQFQLIEQFRFLEKQAREKRLGVWSEKYDYYDKRSYHKEKTGLGKQ